MPKRVLIVDDEEGIRTFIAEVLEEEGFHTTLASDGADAAKLLEKRSFHLMITDLRMPRLDGMELVRLARNTTPEMEIIVLTAHGTVETAVEAIKLGAFDYLRKPLAGPDELSLVVERAMEHKTLIERELKHKPHTIVSTDPIMVPIMNQLVKVAQTTATVFLLGESGTGKEVAARMVHDNSPRAAGPFIAVNCAAVSEELITSEMFGHEKGAFTGAIERRQGRFELADGGTLLLDEVGELSLGLQAKLLRVIQERSFERVGGTRTIEVDVRIVTATNRDLESEMQAGRFREDLYHRLAVFPVRLPPLRQRPADIVPLAEHLLERIGHRLGRAGLVIDDGATSRLLSYAWPGNIRELGNVLERAAIISPSNIITNEDLILGIPEARAIKKVFDGSLKDIEREAICRALEKNNGHRKKTATMLDIGLRTLYDKLKEYKLE
jgi:two-component system, NtrC family, response regulator AtoC